MGIAIYAPTAHSELLHELDEMASDFGFTVWTADEPDLLRAWRAGQRHTASTYAAARSRRLLVVGSCDPDGLPTVIVPRAALDPAADPGFARRVIMALRSVSDALVKALDRFDQRRGGRRVRAFGVEDDVGNVVVCEQAPGPRILERVAVMCPS